MSARRGRPPAWAIVLVCVVLVLVVAGNLLTGYRGRKEDQPSSVTTIPRAQVASLVDRSDAVVLATAADVRRLGDASDPDVIAAMDVERWFKPATGSQTVRVFDTGFEVLWRQGDQMLLFLDRAPGLPQGAQYRVARRCVLATGAPSCGVTPGDVQRVVAGS